MERGREEQTQTRHYQQEEERDERDVDWRVYSPSVFQSVSGL